MLRRLFPHPLLSLLLVVAWLLLVNQFKIGSLVMAVILAIIIPKLTAPYWPNRPPLRNVPAFAAYVLLVMWDIVKANIQVARIVLFMRNKNIRSGWIAVPIDLKTPEAITILAGTITMTPGTVTSDMSSCGRVLLIHALHVPDPASVIHDIKTRYEARLKRIFE
jgi:multicomponent K+:H+ antiporter subunit E